jgi:hypothetical protein
VQKWRDGMDVKTLIGRRRARVDAMVSKGLKTSRKM